MLVPIFVVVDFVVCAGQTHVDKEQWVLHVLSDVRCASGFVTSK